MACSDEVDTTLKFLLESPYKLFLSRVISNPVEQSKQNKFTDVKSLCPFIFTYFGDGLVSGSPTPSLLGEIKSYCVKKSIEILGDVFKNSKHSIL